MLICLCMSFVDVSVQTFCPVFNWVVCLFVIGWCVRAAISKYHTPGGLRNKFVSYSSGSGKSKIKALAGLISS